MSEPLLSIRGLRKAFGGLKVTDDVDLDVMPGQIHALIGPNGAGKSTLIGQITGDVRPDGGKIVWCGQDMAGVSRSERVRLGMVRSFQVSSILPEISVMENVILAALGPKLSLADAWRPVAGYVRQREQAEAALQRVGLGGRESTEAGVLSYGERRHLEIAMALVLKPKVLLLDEPMAGVGPSESKALTQLLSSVSEQCSILLVEHDMDVVFTLADCVSVLVAGRVIETGGPEKIRASKDVQAAYFGEEA